MYILYFSGSRVKSIKVDCNNLMNTIYLLSALGRVIIDVIEL